jgi:hypothetical protein
MLWKMKIHHSLWLYIASMDLRWSSLLMKVFSVCVWFISEFRISHCLNMRINVWKLLNITREWYYRSLFPDCRENRKLVEQLSSKTPGSKDLHFPTQFSQNGWEQLKACLWKQNLSYWRSPPYNLLRISFISSGALLFGLLFWQQGKNM